MKAFKLKACGCGGAVVTRDIPDGVVAYGVPAKVMRKINEKDPI